MCATNQENPRRKRWPKQRTYIGNLCGEERKSSTDKVIISSASESTEKKPIFFNFIPIRAIPENDQLQVYQENVLVTKTYHESEEVSTKLKLGYGSCIANKRKASENLTNFSLSSTACGIKRMRLIDSHKVEKGEGPNGVS